MLLNGGQPQVLESPKHNMVTMLYPLATLRLADSNPHQEWSELPGQR